MIQLFINLLILQQTGTSDLVVFYTPTFSKRFGRNTEQDEAVTADKDHMQTCRSTQW
jgi:hypothetical protein